MGQGLLDNNYIIQNAVLIITQVLIRNADTQAFTASGSYIRHSEFKPECYQDP